MSAHILIKEEGLKSFYLDISTTKVDFELWDEELRESPELITMCFDMKDPDDRKRVSELIEHLQLQLDKDKTFFQRKKN